MSEKMVTDHVCKMNISEGNIKAQNKGRNYLKFLAHAEQQNDIFFPFTTL